MRGDSDVNVPTAALCASAISQPLPTSRSFSPFISPSPPSSVPSQPSSIPSTSPPSPSVSVLKPHLAPSTLVSASNSSFPGGNAGSKPATTIEDLALLLIHATSTVALSQAEARDELRDFRVSLLAPSSPSSVISVAGEGHPPSSHNLLPASRFNTVSTFSDKPAQLLISHQEKEEGLKKPGSSSSSMSVGFSSSSPSVVDTSSLTSVSTSVLTGRSIPPQHSTAILSPDPIPSSSTPPPPAFLLTSAPTSVLQPRSTHSGTPTFLPAAACSTSSDETISDISNYASRTPSRRSCSMGCSTPGSTASFIATSDSGGRGYSGNQLKVEVDGVHCARLLRTSIFQDDVAQSESGPVETMVGHTSAAASVPQSATSTTNRTLMRGGQEDYLTATSSYKSALAWSTGHDGISTTNTDICVEMEKASMATSVPSLKLASLPASSVLPTARAAPRCAPVSCADAFTNDGSSSLLEGHPPVLSNAGSFSSPGHSLSAFDVVLARIRTAWAHARSVASAERAAGHVHASWLTLVRANCRQASLNAAYVALARVRAALDVIHAPPLPLIVPSPSSSCASALCGFAAICSGFSSLPSHFFVKPSQELPLLCNSVASPS
ncbi:hypothetical protein CF326_g8821 [Tilletia indica]|nr:hypothetical protein CF326_g8821 [Tilletia indica]